MKGQQSHGNGRWAPGDFQGFGEGTHIQATVLVFHAGIVEIGDHSDVSTGAIILPGATIGRGVQVGARAVVTSDLPDYAVAAGVSAWLLHKRD